MTLGPFRHFRGERQHPDSNISRIMLPVVAMVAILIAQRYIRKDENLVQSMDRLR